MEPPKTLSIADLINRSLPLSGSVSLLLPSKPPNTPTSSTPPKPSPFQNPNPPILPSLNHPSLITGTVHLPLDGPSSNPCVGGCLSFSDGSATVCCAVLDFDLALLGARIEVLAWNFVPSGDCGGLLEIVRWGFANPAPGSVHGCLSVLVPPPSRDERFSAKARAFGLLRSVSPVFAVPSDGGNLVGFIAEVVACECGVCGGDRSASDLLEGGNCHSFDKPFLVYFYGPVPASSWHPAMTKLLGVEILITGLKRKLVCVGGEESQLMLVTTGRTAAYQTRAGDVCGSIGGMALPGKSELCTYKGVVTGVYMKGLVVELDGKVWLLLTDRSLTLPHTVRVGALISVMNVHLVYPKYSWVKMLLLGACVKTSIDVKSFSPFYSRCNRRRRSQSLLGKFTESLTFSARFWVLLIISCFKRKFAGILSEKDILGSKKQEGLAQMYASSSLPSSAFQTRHGVFMEFCKHDHCCCSNSSNMDPLKLVVHMSNFINNSEELWKTFLSQSQYNATAISKDNKTSLLSCEGKFYVHPIRRIIQSEDLGIVLMGTLQISASSGRLQLLDATGSLDVVVPDLPSNFDSQSVLEVREFTIVIEAPPMQVVCVGPYENSFFSCRSMFEHIQVKKELRKFVIFVHFHLRNATYLNISFRLPSCVVRTDNVKEKESRDGKFHLLLVTHKFPATRYLQDDPVIMSESSLFAEAILLPWGLDLSGEDTKGMLETRSEYGHGQDSEEVWSKRPKMVHMFSTSTTLKDTLVENKKKTSNISCLVNFQSINDHKFLRPANLFSAGSSSRRIFLEFLSKSFYNYVFLRPGWYFMMKFSEDTKNQLAFGTHEKILITFQTCFWSVSFSSFECLQQKAPPTDHSSETSAAAADGVPPNEPPRELSMNQMPEDTDVHLYLSVDAMELLQGDSEYGTLPVQGEVLSVSACFECMMNTPLQYCENFDPSCSLPAGNLTSIFGDVIDVHHLPCSSADETSSITHESMSNVGTLAACNDSLKYICIHVSDGFHMVKIHGLISKHAYPIGLGPGTSATFHRVLIPLSSKGKLGLVLTPVSFIEVDFVKEVYRPSHCSSFWPSSSLNMVEEDTMNTITSILISQLIPYLDNKQFRLRCRVVEIHILVLERAKCLLKGLFKTPDVKIPIAGFILDDGSASCCCWADADRAEKLLRLHEIVIRTSLGRLTGRKSTPHRTQDTISYPLKKMLKKHHRITIKNSGFMEDSSCLNFSSSGHLNQVLTISEETLLKHVILNACAGPVLNVVGSVMDANSLSRVERELTEMQVGMLPIANIWATEVVCTDPLSEARYLLSELSPE